MLSKLRRIPFEYLVLFALLLEPSVLKVRAEDTVAAWVNKKPITEAQVDARMKPILEMIHKKQGRTPDGVLRRKVRDKALSLLIEREVALSSKRAGSISIDPAALAVRIESSEPEEGLSPDEWRKALEEAMILEKLQKSVEEGLPPCTDAEAEALYKQSPELFQSGGRVKISLIVLDFDEIETASNSRRFAVGLANQVFEASNDEWEKAALDYSSGPNADNGGHWDWIEPELLPDGLGKVVAHMSVGGYERVSVGELTYLIRLDAVENRVQLSFDEAKKRVKYEVMRRRGAKAWREWIEAEKKRAVVRIEGDDLW